MTVRYSITTNALSPVLLASTLPCAGAESESVQSPQWLRCKCNQLSQCFPCVPSSHFPASSLTVGCCCTSWWLTYELCNARRRLFQCVAFLCLPVLQSHRLVQRISDPIKRAINNASSHTTERFNLDRLNKQKRTGCVHVLYRGWAVDV